MQLKEIIKKFEGIVPKQIEWEKDNSGLQLGDPDREVKKILICLELTREVIEEAKEQKTDLIFTHHPFFFRAIKKIDYQSPQGSIIKELIKSDISVYSAHTNFDQYKEGISYALADKLGISDMQPLVIEGEFLNKIVTFVPIEASDKVADSLALAGAGQLGNYSDCSFRSPGTGTFQGSDQSNPYIGTRGNKETVEEIRIEMIFPKWKEADIINALLEAHPYEEPAYDIIPLATKTNEYGYGIIGNLANETPAKTFLAELKKILNIPVIRTAGDLNKSIKRIALIGGSGGNYVSTAIAKKADIFITADLSYHTFFSAEDKIIIADAGHYETEVFGLTELSKMLKEILSPDINIIKTRNITNPIIYF